MTEHFWQGKRVVVTGAAGYIGASLTRELYDRGATVVGLDRVTSSPTWTALQLSKVPLWSRDLTLLSTLIETEILFHLAGAVDVHKCEADPLVAFRDNVTTTAKVLAAVRKSSIKAAVFASSDRVYGNQGRALTELSPLLPVDVYGATKAAADVLCAQAARYGFPIATLRHVNAFGELDPHANHLIPSAVASVVKGAQPIINSDGSPRKSYLHIQDVVSAYLIIAQALAEGQPGAGGAFNCTGLDIFSVLEIVSLVCKLAGLTDGPKVLGTDLSQKDYVEYLDGSKLRGYGWCQTVSLHSGIERMIAFYRSKP